MEAGDQPRPLEFRVPVSEDFWREYGVHLSVLLLSLSATAVVVAREPGDGIVVGLVVVGLSLGAVLAGLVMYNVVVAALIAAER
ncbi:hypothetical protein M0R89_01090 [Halorussus limi]|uniref:Uncharacterized protein n=1 Tax=Halorussus limi TaxID=2938695 RepID=A0A8U0HUJ2_9EURY|nr:hypothetical protein [Halorussus limi]UPV74680.1 hypothetical protein M0R89_01090 [Halorussus limi]